MKMRLVQIGLTCAVVLFGWTALAAVFHKEPSNRSEREWSNLYPNDAARVWFDKDTTFAAVDTAWFYPLTAEDSLFTVTRTTIACTVPATVDPNTEFKVIFANKWTWSTVTLLGGEGATFGRVWDSLGVYTDSGRVRINADGHPRW